MKQKIFYLPLILMMFSLTSCSEPNLIGDKYMFVPVFIDFVNNTSDNISYDCKHLALGYTYDNDTDIYRFDPSKQEYKGCVSLVTNLKQVFDSPHKDEFTGKSAPLSANISSRGSATLEGTFIDNPGVYSFPYTPAMVIGFQIDIKVGDQLRIISGFPEGVIEDNATVIQHQFLYIRA